MKKKTELKFYAIEKRRKQTLQAKERGFLTTSIQANHPPTPHYQTSRPSLVKPTKIKPGLRPNYLIVWIITNQETNKEEVKLQRKLYQKLIESSVRPSSNLGASSQKSYQQKKSEKFPEFDSDFWILEIVILSKILGYNFQKSGLDDVE